MNERTKRNNVRNFFKNDYPRLVLLTAGQTTAIKSSNNDRFTYYQNIFNLISMTIAKMENTEAHPYKRLIIEHCINQRTIKDIEPSMGYKYHMLVRKMNKALDSFVNEFRKQQIKYSVYPLVTFNK